MNAVSHFFTVCPFVDEDRRESFVVKRTDYYTRDGHVFATEHLSEHETRAEAEAMVGHYKVGSMREP